MSIPAQYWVVSSCIWYMLHIIHVCCIAHFARSMRSMSAATAERERGWHFRSLGLSPAVCLSLPVCAHDGAAPVLLLWRRSRPSPSGVYIRSRGALVPPPSTFGRPGEASCRPPSNKHPPLAHCAHPPMTTAAAPRL
jgi:hypothetical protein